MNNPQHPTTDHRAMEPYRNAGPAARAAVDVIFKALDGMDTGYRGVGIDHRDGSVTASFHIPQAAGEPRAFTAFVSPDGHLRDVRVAEYTGRMVEDGEDEGEEEIVLRRVRAGGTIVDVLLRALREKAREAGK